MTSGKIVWLTGRLKEYFTSFPRAAWERGKIEAELAAEWEKKDD